MINRSEKFNRHTAASLLFSLPPLPQPLSLPSSTFATCTSREVFSLPASERGYACVVRRFALRCVYSYGEEEENEEEKEEGEMMAANVDEGEKKEENVQKKKDTDRRA